MPNLLPFMEPENETILENEQEEQIVETTEEVVELTVEQKLAKAEAEAHKWRRIAQKNQKAQPTETKPQITNNPELSDELKLIARGLSDEEIDKAKVIARGTGVSLIEAIKDPLFTTFQEKLKEEQKKADAKLGASRGSRETQEELTGTEFGSSRDEHIKAFKKVMGS